MAVMNRIERAAVNSYFQRPTLNAQPGFGKAFATGLPKPG